MAVMIPRGGWCVNPLNSTQMQHQTVDPLYFCASCNRRRDTFVTSVGRRICTYCGDQIKPIATPDTPDASAMIVAMMERLRADRDRYRTALERIYANAVDDHPSDRDYAGDVLHGARA